MQTNIQFKNYPTERLIIDSIASRLADNERLFRNQVMEYIVNNGGPAYISDLKLLPKLRNLDVDGMAKNLINKRVLVKGSEDAINFAYPVSALPTSHKVTLQDGRSLHAMCAIDAMGIAFAFGQDIEINSTCKTCMKPIHVKIKDERIVELSPLGTHVLHVDLKKLDNWTGSC